MMFEFGKWVDVPATRSGFRRLGRTLASRSGESLDFASKEMLELLDPLSALWLKDSAVVDRFKGLSTHEVGGLFSLLSRQGWQERLLADLIEPSILHALQPWDVDRRCSRAVPLGGIFHAFGPSCRFEIIDACLAGVLTRNVSVLLVPTAREALISAFLRTLEKADSRGVLARNIAVVPVGADGVRGLSELTEHINAFFRWTGYGYRGPALRHLKVRWIDVPSGLPIHIISRQFWERCDHRCLVSNLTPDSRRVAPGPDARPRIYYVEEGVDVGALVAEVGPEWQELGGLSSGSVEARNGMRKTEAAPALPGAFRKLLDGDDVDAPWLPRDGDSLSRQFRATDGSLLIIFSYRGLDDLQRQLARLPAVPAACCYGLDDVECQLYQTRLGQLGVRRFLPLASRRFTEPMSGLHLSELVRFVTDQRIFRVEDLLRDSATQVPFYRRRRPLGDVADIESWQLITGADLASEPLDRSNELLHSAVSAGTVFSSGGTSTAPKYALYTPAEFNHSADMLARGFIANGLSAGDKVINLFVAGNLWSSFLVVHEALQRCGVYILPMGGLSPTEEIIACLTSFKPNVAFGLPSLLVDCARHCEKAGVEIRVGKIFYAGEHLNPSARRYLRTVWNTRSFHSAGYAAVDVGPIGWQCTHCQGGEHHLFAREVHLEIVGEEAVVTSLVRRAMPVIRYRTGDRVEWLPGHCPCGSGDPRFRLLGRIDGLMNIWGCHLALADVETSLIEAGMTASIFQLVLCVAPCDSGYSEQLVVRLEQDAVSADFLARFSERLHHNSKDVGLTLSQENLTRQLRVECVAAQEIPRIARTGKVRLIVDRRDSG